ncbi:Uncharacterised protein [Zhongshania aliphaticivorans]|uniref:UPF0260 protein IHBHHGIJ_01485 n=1 Tax=Zhongshania aliphaticivorans TaxID=1470434 RepID=A0A5S9QPH6_9GAMM|nr:YcgN family cysteine cluster protein [Zhongshania aliphaticivorans]CAA0088200.1 Uncharacterised protein [Zhongshania aliphaticivorans]CAA0116137.1 Uncharacterised protein [Zhongshania aliphaticivorans]CAA0120375.1 Uncharacterised protein [Zhongshania aliphaticivorans]
MADIVRRPFWERKTLAEMSAEEWESVCDGCGKCCLHKLEDHDSGEVFYTDVACRLLDTDQCRCSNYGERRKLVPNCVSLRESDPAEMFWLPQSCGYRTLAEGRELEDWHPLISGNTDSVHFAAVSVRGRCMSESKVDTEDYEDRIIYWVE